MADSRVAVEVPDTEGILRDLIDAINFTSEEAFKNSLTGIIALIQSCQDAGRITQNLVLLSQCLQDHVNKSTQEQFNTSYLNNKDRQAQYLSAVKNQYLPPSGLHHTSRPSSDDNAASAEPVLTGTSRASEIHSPSVGDADKTKSEASSQITITQTPLFQSKSRHQGTIYVNDRQHIERLIQAFNTYKARQLPHRQKDFGYTKSEEPQRDKKSTSASEMNTLHTFSFPDDASAKVFFEAFIRNNPGVLRDAQNNEIESFEQIKAMQSGEALASSEEIRLSSMPMTDKSKETEADSSHRFL